MFLVLSHQHCKPIYHNLFSDNNFTKVFFLTAGNTLKQLTSECNFFKKIFLKYISFPLSLRPKPGPEAQKFISYLELYLTTKHTQLVHVYYTPGSVFFSLMIS